MSKMKIGSIAFTVILIFAVVSPAASATLIFKDDFNDGDFNDWDTYSGSYGEANTSNVTPTHDGSFYAKMTDNAWMRKSVNTTGYGNIYLSCYIRTDFQSSTNNDKDRLRINWRVGKSGSFTSLGTIEGASGWIHREWNLPSEACDKEEIQIRFKLKNCEATDFACVDDVLVTDTPTGAPIPISADVGGHKIRFVSHTTNGGNSIWTYSITTGCKPSLSHWSIAWCGEEADILQVSEKKWEYHTDTYGGVPITGIKFDKGYDCDDNTGTPETRTVSFELKGDWHEGSVLVGTKAGRRDEATGYVTGPVCSDPSIPEFATIAIPVVAILGLVAFYRRKQKK